VEEEVIDGGGQVEKGGEEGMASAGLEMAGKESKGEGWKARL